ncbi:hypothetical protein CJ030_MR5G017212 [Morella rubra]|uniref:Uncharacterized protein n=1 Tax=Morella rubra TaxID=262757 RepID=A0A6A1VM12_9ROSI|nr:hypothetical protein CJ030_MR5G017212 [Morella rubra]
MRVSSTPARYPSTVESGRSSLLCETSLTLCPPLQEPQGPSFRLGRMVQLSTWNGRASELRKQTLPHEAEALSRYPVALARVTSLRYQARQSVTNGGKLKSLLSPLTLSSMGQRRRIANPKLVI